MKSATRILAAVAPDTAERIERILAGYELAMVHHMEEASAALRTGDVHLIVIGTRFDESRMFDLLQFIRSDAEHQKIPIVAAVIAPSTMAADTIAGLHHTTKLYGASVFLNLNDFPDDEIGNKRIRLIVEALLIPADEIPKAGGASQSPG